MKRKKKEIIQTSGNGENETDCRRDKKEISKIQYITHILHQHVCVHIEKAKNIK